jgi:hypothetical protein
VAKLDEANEKKKKGEEKKKFCYFIKDQTIESKQPKTMHQHECNIYQVIYLF